MKKVRKEDIFPAVKTPPVFVREIETPPRFAPGDTIRVAIMHPIGHTRLPRYARGRVGVIEQVRGSFSFPDTNAHGRGEHPQHLYNVRFEAKELWGPEAPSNEYMYLDLWHNYISGREEASHG